MKRILLFTMMASFGAFAADKVWTNETGDGNWGTDGNWSDHVAPTASDADMQKALADIFRIVTEAADIDMAMPGIEG